MKNDDVSVDDDLLPEYDLSTTSRLSRAAFAASTSSVTAPARTSPCSNPTCARLSQPMRPSTKHSDH